MSIKVVWIFLLGDLKFKDDPYLTQCNACLFTSQRFVKTCFRIAFRFSKHVFAINSPSTNILHFKGRSPKAVGIWFIFYFQSSDTDILYLGFSWRTWSKLAVCAEQANMREPTRGESDRLTKSIQNHDWILPTQVSLTRSFKSVRELE